MLKVIGNFIKKISYYLSKISQILIFTVMVLMVTNIILRAVIGEPIRGIYDILILIYIIIISFSLAQCAEKDGHVYVDFFLEKTSKKTKNLCLMGMNIVSFIFFSFTGIYFIKYAQLVKLRGKSTMTTDTPHFPFVYIISLGFILLALIILIKIIKQIKEVGDSE